MTLVATIQTTAQPPTPKVLSPLSPSFPSNDDHVVYNRSESDLEPWSAASDISRMPGLVDPRTGEPVSPDEMAVLRGEEPLYLPTDYGAGFFPGAPGMKLKDGRYQIVIKLGWGRQSSTWLVEDLKSESESVKYFAAKIVNAAITEMNKEGIALELECLLSIKEDAAKNTCLPQLVDHFELDGPHGGHICLVMNVLSTDVQSYRLASPERRLTLHSVRYIIASVLSALVILEQRDIIHTDLKPDNLLFVNDSCIDHFLEDVAPTSIGTVLINDEPYPIMRTQPIPTKFSWDDSKEVHAKYKVCLADFGSAQRAQHPPTTEILGAYALRAPEIIMGGPITTKVDVWALGCIAFELLIGRWLFPLEPCEEYSVESEHIARMMELTGQSFENDFLQLCKYRDQFFKPDGNPYVRTSTNISVEKAISNYRLPDLTPSDISETASFMAACLTLDPSKRPLASELVNHPWMKGACTLDDYRDPDGILTEKDERTVSVVDNETSAST